ncbi:MAG: hypothetical protein HKN25_17530 [Pyrinomonadaceae bacterium]|nr:hypothetical protein [Pyrinomonadaceae bacterium]
MKRQNTFLIIANPYSQLVSSIVLSMLLTLFFNSVSIAQPKTDRLQELLKETEKLNIWRKSTVFLQQYQNARNEIDNQNRVADRKRLKLLKTEKSLNESKSDMGTAWKRISEIYEKKEKTANTEYFSKAVDKLRTRIRSLQKEYRESSALKFQLLAASRSTDRTVRLKAQATLALWGQRNYPEKLNTSIARLKADLQGIVSGNSNDEKFVVTTSLVAELVELHETIEHKSKAIQGLETERIRSLQEFIKEKHKLHSMRFFSYQLARELIKQLRTLNSNNVPYLQTVRLIKGPELSLFHSSTWKQPNWSVLDQTLQRYESHQETYEKAINWEKSLLDKYGNQLGAVSKKYQETLKKYSDHYQYALMADIGLEFVDRVVGSRGDPIGFGIEAVKSVYGFREWMKSKKPKDKLPSLPGAVLAFRKEHSVDPVLEAETILARDPKASADKVFGPAPSVTPKPAVANQVAKKELLTRSGQFKDYLKDYLMDFVKITNDKIVTGGQKSDLFRSWLTQKMSGIDFSKPSNQTRELFGKSGSYLPPSKRTSRAFRNFFNRKMEGDFSHWRKDSPWDKKYLAKLIFDKIKEYFLKISDEEFLAAANLEMEWFIVRQRFHLQAARMRILEDRISKAIDTDLRDAANQLKSIEIPKRTLEISVDKPLDGRDFKNATVELLYQNRERAEAVKLKGHEGSLELQPALGFTRRVALFSPGFSLPEGDILFYRLSTDSGRLSNNPEDVFDSNPETIPVVYWDLDRAILMFRNVESEADESHTLRFKSQPSTALKLEPYKTTFVGAYKLTYVDKVAGVVKGYGIIGPEGKAFGYFDTVNGKPETFQMKLIAGLQKIDGSYSPYNGNIRITLQGTPSGFDGNWIYRARSDSNKVAREGASRAYEGDQQLWYTTTGKENWTRLKPRIKRIDIKPVDNRQSYPISLDWLRKKWLNASRAGSSKSSLFPRLNLIISGDELPVKIPLHFLHYQNKILKIEFNDPGIQLIESRPINNARQFQVTVSLLPDVIEGKKIIRIQGEEFEFELKFKQ